MVINSDIMLILQYQPNEDLGWNEKKLSTTLKSTCKPYQVDIKTMPLYNKLIS